MVSAVSVLVVTQSSSEIPEGLMNNPVYLNTKRLIFPVTDPVVAQRMGRGIALLFHDRGTRSG